MSWPGTSRRSIEEEISSAIRVWAAASDKDRIVEGGESLGREERRWARDLRSLRRTKRWAGLWE